MEVTRDEHRIQENAKITLSEQQVSCEFEDSRVILNFEDGMYYELDSVGARLWDLIQEPRTFREVHRILLEEYDVDEERCRSDLESLFCDMASQGLVMIEDL